jgi:hypothetical protein
MLLGKVAFRSGESSHYHPQTGPISDSPRAAHYLKPSFRPGAEL